MSKSKDPGHEKKPKYSKKKSKSALNEMPAVSAASSLDTHCNPVKVQHSDGVSGSKSGGHSSMKSKLKRVKKLSKKTQTSFPVDYADYHKGLKDLLKKSTVDPKTTKESKTHNARKDGGDAGEIFNDKKGASHKSKKRQPSHALAEDDVIDCSLQDRIKHEQIVTEMLIRETTPDDKSSSCHDSNIFEENDRRETRKDSSTEKMLNRKMSRFYESIIEEPKEPRADVVIGDSGCSDDKHETDEKQTYRERLPEKYVYGRNSRRSEPLFADLRAIEISGIGRRNTICEVHCICDVAGARHLRKESFSEKTASRRSCEGQEAIGDETQRPEDTDMERGHGSCYDRGIPDENLPKHTRKESWCEISTAGRVSKTQEEPIVEEPGPSQPNGCYEDKVSFVDDDKIHSNDARKGSVYNKPVVGSMSGSQEPITGEPPCNVGRRHSGKESLSKKSSNRSVYKRQNTFIEEEATYMEEAPWASPYKAVDSQAELFDGAHQHPAPPPAPPGPTYQHKATQWDLEDCWDRPLIFQESMSTLTEEFLAAAAHIRLHLDDLMPDDSHMLCNFEGLLEDIIQVREGVVLIDDPQHDTPQPARLRLTEDTLLVQRQELVYSTTDTEHVDPTLLAKERTVAIVREQVGGLGLSVKGGAEHHLPVLISRIFKDQAADRTGKLFVGDAIHRVNQTNIENYRHDDAVALLKNAGDEVTLVVKYFRPASLFLNRNKRSERDEDNNHNHKNSVETVPDTPLEQEWSTMARIPLLGAYVTRYMSDTDKMRTCSLEVVGLTLSSGIIHCDDNHTANDWLASIAHNINLVTTQAMVLANKLLLPSQQAIHMCWAWERSCAPKKLHSWTPTYVALKAADVSFFEKPPLKPRDWNECKSCHKIYECMLRVLKDSELLDGRSHCLMIQTGNGNNHYLGVESRQDLLRLEKAWYRSNYLAVKYLGSKTFGCTWRGCVSGLTLDLNMGFSLYDSESKSYMWNYRFSQLKGSSDDGRTRLKLNFLSDQTQQIEIRELECTELQTLLFSMHAFLSAKLASVDPTFLTGL